MFNEAEVDIYIDKILRSLKKIGPRLVMVFGSYSKGEINENSDLDLLIVLDKDEVPKSYDEKIEMKLEIRRILRDINRRIAIDLLVYTLPEYEEFMKSDSSFSKEIIETGKVLCEKTS